MFQPLLKPWTEDSLELLDQDDGLETVRQVHKKWGSLPSPFVGRPLKQLVRPRHCRRPRNLMKESTHDSIENRYLQRPDRQ